MQNQPAPPPEQATVSSSLPPSEPAPDPAPRSRRAVLAGALGALVGGAAGALGRPSPARPAAGDPLIIGQTNFAESSATRLNGTSSGGAFWVTQFGFGSGVRGDSVSGHGSVFTTSHADRHGVFAQQLGADGAGAAVRADGGNNHGVHATSNIVNSSPVHAVHGVTASHVGAAVFADGQGGRGVHAASDLQPAVFAESSTIGVQAVGPDYGVYSQSGNQFGVALQGIAGGSSGHGVVGAVTNDSANASGVYAEAAAGTGASFAGYFVGKLHCTGNLSKAGGSFRIDHPLDPANKLLQHSFVESPDMLNIYSGIASVDEHGEATVEVADWFEALNRDVRYQLTAVGAAMPGLYVKSKLDRGRFVIGGAAPGFEVSWLLTGIRQDAWAEANRIEVELDKPREQKGKFLHPAAHGQPEEKGVDYAMRRRIAKGLGQSGASA